MKEEKIHLDFLLFCVVRMKGLEPPRLTTLDPKSSAATNYATCASFVAAKVIRVGRLSK